MKVWRLGVIGSPIDHSVSPQLHAAGLAYLGFEGSSIRLDIDEANAGRIREVMGPEFDALSLTMPLKAVAATLCDELDERARSLGVVNSLLWRDEKLLGTSTDGAGFIDSLRGEFSLSVADMHVVVMGSGAAARAIVDSLVREDVHSITVLGRNPTTVLSLVDQYSNVADHSVIFRPVDLIVNTTPSLSREPVNAVMQGVTRETVAVDITYEPRLSSWLERHAQLGCRNTNGLSMLAYTVARQMNWWWDSDIPGSYLLAALLQAIE